MSRRICRRTPRSTRGQELGSFTRLVQNNAEAELQRFIADATRNGIAVARTRAEPGVASQVILDAAKHDGYDLIVMGTQGRTGLSRALIGSVAERVVGHSPCPVLTVRAGS